MRLNRDILRVKSMLNRATTVDELIRLTRLLLLLQSEYIEVLEKRAVKLRKVA